MLNFFSHFKLNDKVKIGKWVGNHCFMGMKIEHIVKKLFFTAAVSEYLLIRFPVVASAHYLCWCVECIGVFSPNIVEFHYGIPGGWGAGGFR